MGIDRTLFRFYPQQIIIRIESHIPRDPTANFKVLHGLVGMVDEMMCISLACRITCTQARFQNVLAPIGNQCYLAKKNENKFVFEGMPMA